MSNPESFNLFEVIARVHSLPKVYPGYLAHRIVRALRERDACLPGDEHIVAGEPAMETIGDCRYRVIVTDHNGTRYHITVEVAP